LHLGVIIVVVIMPTSVNLSFCLKFWVAYMAIAG